MTGYPAADVAPTLANDCDCEDREALVRPEGLVCGTCGKLIDPRGASADVEGDAYSGSMHPITTSSEELLTSVDEE